ncbi:295_t:CDS:2 [Entrophospora sp. SA101]|nr:12508_t:CDS:2 [Entrophospora sp. SA101]CAJ0831436.1 295_t:CDS:2 [Entrophospora sp. SA101]
MSNTTTHLTPDDILTRDDLAELAIWESAQFNSNNIIHQHDFISLAAANQYPIFNYPTTINSIATRQSIFSVPPPTSSISRVAIPGSLIDNNNHTTKKKSAKSSFSNDVPRNISTNQKILLPKPLQEAPTSISSNNNNSHGHGNESKNQSSSSSIKEEEIQQLQPDFGLRRSYMKRSLRELQKEMTARTELLDERVKELEMENKWLRKLIVEKDAKLLLDVIDKNKDK